MQCPMTVEQAVDGGAPAEIEKIRAAAHGDVLAVIDHCAVGRIEKRAGAAAELAAGFKEFDLAAAFDEGDSGGEAGQPAADDGDLRGGRVQCSGIGVRGSGFRSE
jgi:hypothetical protein